MWKWIGEGKEWGKDGERKRREMENRITRYLKGVIVVAQGYPPGSPTLHHCKYSRTTNLLF